MSRSLPGQWRGEGEVSVGGHQLVSPLIHHRALHPKTLRQELHSGGEGGTAAGLVTAPETGWGLPPRSLSETPQNYWET